MIARPARASSSTEPSLRSPAHGGRKRIGDRAGERIAPAGDKRDVNAGSDGVVDGSAIGLREMTAAVEQRAVDIDTDQPNHARKGAKQRIADR